MDINIGRLGNGDGVEVTMMKYQACWHKIAVQNLAKSSLSDYERDVSKKTSRL